MGKKYIIELNDDCTSEFKGIMVFGLTQEKQISVELIPEESLRPYTEPDLEQVRKEAYEKGVQDTKQHWADTPRTCAYKLGYENGINDAWEAARKIALMDTETSENVTGYFGLFRIMDNLTASEAIEKIRQYEQEKEEFHIGDEFENGSGQKFVVLKMDGKEIDRYTDGDGRTYVMDVKYPVMRKTGRHFPEIAAVLEKMREEQAR